MTDHLKTLEATVLVQEALIEALYTKGPNPGLLHEYTQRFIPIIQKANQTMPHDPEFVAALESVNRRLGARVGMFR